MYGFLNVVFRSLFAIHGIIVCKYIKEIVSYTDVYLVISLNRYKSICLQGISPNLFFFRVRDFLSPGGQLENNRQYGFALL